MRTEIITSAIDLAARIAPIYSDDAPGWPLRGARFKLTASRSQKYLNGSAFSEDLQ